MSSTYQPHRQAVKGHLVTYTDGTTYYRYKNVNGPIPKLFTWEVDEGCPDSWFRGHQCQWVSRSPNNLWSFERFFAKNRADTKLWVLGFPSRVSPGTILTGNNTRTSSTTYALFQFKKPDGSLPGQRHHYLELAKWPLPSTEYRRAVFELQQKQGFITIEQLESLMMESLL